jgi:hypothetical protein
MLDFGIECINFKDQFFAVVYNKSNSQQTTLSLLKDEFRHTGFNPTRFNKVQSLYHKIKDGLLISIEDVYSVIGIDNLIHAKNLIGYKRKTTKEYRNLVVQIIDRSIAQIQKNIDKVNMPELAYSIFLNAQEFTEDKPKYSPKLWFIGNSSAHNKIVSKAFENFTRASIVDKSNPEFCVKSITDLLNAYKECIEDSFRCDYMDSIIDQIHFWYFTEADQDYNYLIFMPEAFDEIKDFLKSVLDNNPFHIYVKLDNENQFMIKKNECEPCTNCQNLISIAENSYQRFTSIRMLKTELEDFYNKRKALVDFGVLDYKVYNITEHFKKYDEAKRCKLERLIRVTTLLDPLIEHVGIIHDKDDFIKQNIKQQIAELLGESLAA